VRVYKLYLLTYLQDKLHVNAVYNNYVVFQSVRRLLTVAHIRTLCVIAKLLTSYGSLNIL